MHFFLSETEEDPEDRNQPQQVNDELTKMKEELGKERHKLKARNEGKVYSLELNMNRWNIRRKSREKSDKKEAEEGEIEEGNNGEDRN